MREVAMREVAMREVVMREVVATLRCPMTPAGNRVRSTSLPSSRPRNRPATDAWPGDSGPGAPSPRP